MLVGLLCSGTLAPVLADGVISVEPAIVAPDSNGVVRFSVMVTGIPEPGFRSYALSVRFDGAAVELVDTINTINRSALADKISCASKLRLDAVAETVVPRVGVILESGQGALVLDRAGAGVVLAMSNGTVDANTVRYNIGVAGKSVDDTPRVGNGSLIDFRCLVGEAVPDGTRVSISPGLYPGLDGAIFVDEPGNAPVIDTFEAGYIDPAANNDAPVTDPARENAGAEDKTLTSDVASSDPAGTP